MASKIFQCVMFMVCTLSISNSYSIVNPQLLECLKAHITTSVFLQVFGPCIQDDRRRDRRPCSCTDWRGTPLSRDTQGFCPFNGHYSCAHSRFIDAILNSDGAQIMTVISDNPACLNTLSNFGSAGGAFANCARHPVFLFRRLPNFR